MTQAEIIIQQLTFAQFGGGGSQSSGGDDGEAHAPGMQHSPSLVDDVGETILKV